MIRLGRVGRALDELAERCTQSHSPRPRGIDQQGRGSRLGRREVGGEGGEPDRTTPVMHDYLIARSRPSSSLRDGHFTCRSGLVPAGSRGSSERPNPTWSGGKDAAVSGLATGGTTSRQMFYDGGLPVKHHHRRSVPGLDVRGDPDPHACSWAHDGKPAARRNAHPVSGGLHPARPTLPLACASRRRSAARRRRRG